MAVTTSTLKRADQRALLGLSITHIIITLLLLAYQIWSTYYHIKHFNRPYPYDPYAPWPEDGDTTDYLGHPLHPRKGLAFFLAPIIAFGVVELALAAAEAFLAHRIRKQTADLKHLVILYGVNIGFWAVVSATAGILWAPGNWISGIAAGYV